MSAEDPTEDRGARTVSDPAEPVLPVGVTDLASRTLAQVKAEAVKKMGEARGASRRQASGDAARTRADGKSAARRATRGDRTSWQDPQSFGGAIESVVQTRGWQSELAVAGILGDWAAAVGTELAAHCAPVSLTDGELTLVAESTAWATQIRLLSAQLLTTLADRVGPEVVTSVRVHGPTSPSWGHGKLRAPGGRGPRDTYG